MLQRSGAPRSAAVECLLELRDVELRLSLHLGGYATGLRLVWIAHHIDEHRGHDLPPHAVLIDEALLVSGRMCLMKEN